MEILEGDLLEDGKRLRDAAVKGMPNKKMRTTERGDSNFSTLITQVLDRQTRENELLAKRLELEEFFFEMESKERAQQQQMMMEACLVD